MSENQGLSDFLESAATPPPRPWYRQRDFWLGFGLFWTITIAAGLLSRGLYRQITTINIVNYVWNEVLTVISDILNFWLVLPLLFVLGMILYFISKRRRWVTFGLLVGFALYLVVLAILGVRFIIYCLSTGSLCGLG